MQDKAYFLSLQEKEDTVSSQGKQILELHTQLKTSVAALEVSDIIGTYYDGSGHFCRCG